MGMNSVARPHSAPFEKRSGRDVGLRPHTAGPTAPHSRGHPIRSHTRGVSRPGSPWRAQRAQLKAIMQNYEANVRALEDGRGKSAASDELRSRIKESVLRSSEALSPSNRSRLNRRQAYAKTLGSREPEKLTTGIRPQPDDDEKGGHPDSCSDDVRGKSESDEQEFSEDEDGGDDTDRLEVLQAQRHLLTREGLPPGICQLDGRIEKLRARIRTDREEKEETLLQRKLAGLRSNHQMREFAAIKECTEDRVLLQKQMDQEMEDMVATQESEVFELMEEASKRAANQVAACKCTKEYLCQHNRRAFIQTRKRTKEVLKCHDNAKRLRRCRQFQEAKKWEKMARDLDKKHDLEWRKMVITSVTKNEWGAGNGSKVELLMRKHCLQRQALQQAHRNRASLLDRACEFKLKTLRSALGAEEFKLKRRAHFAQKQRILDARDMLTARRRHAKTNRSKATRTSIGSRRRSQG